MRVFKSKVNWLVLIIIIASVPLFAQDPFNLDPLTYGKSYTNGAAWGDYNGDGYQDFYFSNGHNESPTKKNYLFLNNGDGTFTEQDSASGTAGTIVTKSIISGGSTWGDYDNDGELDLFTAEVFTVASSFPFNFLTEYSLYNNNGDNTFSENAAGDLTLENEDCGASASWADYDNDGYLDVCLSVTRISVAILAKENALYHNNQDGTFTKISNNLTTDKNHQGGLAWCDFDRDGDMDIAMVAGRVGQRTVMWENTGTDFDSTTILRNQDAQGCSWADYDNDGDFDLLVTCNGSVSEPSNPIAEHNFLYINDGGTLTQASESTAGELTADTSYSNTSAWADYDNDGDLDIYIGNSNKERGSALYINDGSGVFTKATNTVIQDSSLIVRTAAWADLNNDGDLDLIIGQDGKNRLFRNQLSNGNHYINIELEGATANRSGIGSVVRVLATIDGNQYWQMREISGQTGFGGQNSLRAHFGLGDAVVIDSVVIEWAGSSTVDRMANVTVDQFLKIQEGNASAIGDNGSITPNKYHLQQNYPNPFNPSTTIDFTMAKAGDVTVDVFNIVGQKVATLYKGFKAVGNHTVKFNAAEFSAGLYFYTMKTAEFTQTHKMMLLK